MSAKQQARSALPNLICSKRCVHDCKGENEIGISMVVATSETSIYLPSAFQHILYSVRQKNFIAVRQKPCMSLCFLIFFSTP